MRSDTDIDPRQRQHDIFPAESKAIDQGLADTRGSALQSHIVQVAGRVRIGQMQRGRNELMLHGQCRANDLKGATRREGMPQGAALVSGDLAHGFKVTMMWLDKEMTDGDKDNPTLKKSPVCDGSETGMAQQSCCPADADAPAGVRCARFSFVP